MCIRIPQQSVNQIYKGTRKNVDTKILISICLVLGLSEEESIDFLARRDRALNPALPLHEEYRKLIRNNPLRGMNYDNPRLSEDELYHVLDEVNFCLQKAGFEKFGRDDI